MMINSSLAKLFIHNLLATNTISSKLWQILLDVLCNVRPLFERLFELCDRSRQVCLFGVRLAIACFTNRTHDSAYR